MEVQGTKIKALPNDMSTEGLFSFTLALFSLIHIIHPWPTSYSPKTFSPNLIRFQVI